MSEKCIRRRPDGRLLLTGLIKR